jgi:hypothetical protein
MADDLTQALTGLNYTPADTGYGIAQMGLSSLTPQLITPYSSTGRAVGIGLGSILLQSLLGYQARQQAAQDTLELNSLANQLMTKETPQARTDFIGGVSDPGYQSRLSTLSTALTAQQAETNRKLNEAVGLETGKIKALQQFYSTPEGAAQRKFEIDKIKEEAAARRSPIEDILLQEEARKNRQIAVEEAKNAGKKELQDIKNANNIELENLRIAARSGDAAADRDFKAKQNELNRDHENVLAKTKIELGEDAAVSLKQRLNDLEMANLAADKDPKLARAQALSAINTEAKEKLLERNDELIRQRTKEYNDQITQRALLKKELDLKHPTLTGKIKDAVADAGGFANIAKGVAADIRKISSYPEYKAAKNISGIGDANLKSRIKDIVDRLTRVRSGLATRGVEDETMETILLGDSTLGPQGVANLLERVANDTLKVAADKISAGTQNPVELARIYREAAEKNTSVLLNPQTFTAGSQVNLADLEAELKALQAKRQQLEKQKGIR